MSASQPPVTAAILDATVPLAETLCRHRWTQATASHAAIPMTATGYANARMMIAILMRASAIMSDRELSDQQAFLWPHNAAVERRRDHVSSAPHVHNEMAHLRRARDDGSPSAPTAC